MDRDYRKSQRESYSLEKELLHRLRTGDHSEIRPYALYAGSWYALDFVVSYESPQNTGPFVPWADRRLDELIDAYRKGLVQESVAKGRWKLMIYQGWGPPLCWVFRQCRL